MTPISQGSVFTFFRSRCNTVLFLMLAILMATLSHASDYREVDWVELIPDDDLQALLLPPEWVNDIEDGSPEDDLTALRTTRSADEREARYQEALQSSKVRPEFDQQKIRIPGFVVPLVINDSNQVTEFFLVPYMGACLHFPPPPPNQIIHVSYPEGMEMPSLYEPYWVEGLLEIRRISHHLGEAAYALQASGFELYDY